MPRVYPDYVVSFSSEDPEQPASNLLNREVSKKKWLCKKGESSCSVVLQLPRAVKITGVQIGAYHAALVEVLVGRSETSSEQFQVLVPSCVFASASESRRDAPLERVRSFGAEQLSAAARDQRWDRVRLVCSQPYNKHCQFGLSFVHVDEAESSVPPRLLQLDALSSDEEDFKPGELFAKHLQNTSAGETPPNTSTDTGAQIRQATLQALKNIPESSTKLIKTSISKPRVKRAHTPPRETHDATSATPNKHDKTDKLNNTIPKTKDESKRTPKRNKNDSPSRPQRNDDKPTSDKHKDKEVRKRRRSDSQEQPESLAAGPASASRHALLRGAVLALSGYAHPRRAAVRDRALALGARVARDWGPDCTHLICAFPNTPKLRAARAASGPDVPVVLADWLEECSRARRLLPWRWWATELHQRVPRDDVQTDTTQTRHDPDSEGDTDDEIEKVLQKQKKRRLTDSSTSDDVNKRDVAPVATASDAPRPPSRVREPEDEGSTDEEAPAPSAPPDPARALPDFFDGFTFAIDAAPHDAQHMARYVRAYGGLVLQMSEVEQGSEVDYIVRGRRGRGADDADDARTVSAAWLARCHAARARLPHRS